MALLCALRDRGRFARWSSRARLGLVLASLLASCKSSSSESTKGVAPLAPEPERFQFALPRDYAPRELRGEGSETLRAPPDAQVRAHPTGLSVEAGSDFALEIQFQPALGLPAGAEGVRRVLSESDLVVFESGGAYWFVVLRELVPEWDESERRRVACSSAGAGTPAALARRFSRAAVERMVAACRSIELPRLD
jgi:hypothetical protein